MRPALSALLLMLVLAACARVAPVRASTPEFTAESDGVRVRLADGTTGRTLIDRRRSLVIVEGNALRPEVRLEPVAGGYDLIATFRNDDAAARPLATLVVPSIMFGREITWYDFRRGSQPQRVDHAFRGLRRGDHPYPSDLYSPVAVIADEQHAIGASLLYDPRTARHEVNIAVRTEGYAPTTDDPDPPSGKRWTWFIVFELKGSLPPGEARTYRLAVRAAPAERWIDTLRPYADHFHATFGTQTYEPDPRPVRGYAVAGNHEQNDANPRGFTFATRRPDTQGFGPWVAHIAQEAARGYDRTMIWALSGLHDNDGFNYPPIFATGLREMPRADQSAPLFNRLSDAGVSVGFWWGRSQQVLEGFADTSIEFLDPDNPEHVAAAFAELDRAIALGADELGLDAFAYLPAWEAERWLLILQRRAPGVRFILEPTPCDMLHRLAPSYTRAEILTHRHALADLLMPRHESWAQIRYDTLRRRLGRALTPAETQLEVQRVAALGFVPVLFEPVPDVASISAAIPPAE